MKLSVRFLDSPKPVQIRHLVIESNALSARDRRQVVQQFEGRDFQVAEELAESGSGWRFETWAIFAPSVDGPQVSFGEHNLLMRGAV